MTEAVRPALLIALLTTLLLAACDRVGVSEPAESRIPPGLAAPFHPPEGWAWATLPGSRLRYGVSAPPVVSHAHVLVLPDPAEPAETWFESARALNAAGYTVWLLDLTGAGDAERARAATAAMIGQVIRPAPRGPPLVVLAEGAGAYPALLSAAPTLILSAPRQDAARSWAPAWLAAAMTAVRLGDLAIPFQPGWSRSAPDAFARGLSHDRYRGGTGQAWRTANPDLRRRLTFADLAGAEQLRRAALDAGRAPALLLSAPGDDAEVAALCRAPCRQIEAKGDGAALHLEADRHRDPWLSAVKAAIAEQVLTARNRSFQGAGPGLGSRANEN